MKKAAIAAILALLWGSALAQQATLTATWTAPHTAVVSWSGGELWRVSGGLETHIDGPSPQTLGRGGDFAYAPKAGDVYQVRSTSTGAVLAFTTLGLAPGRITLPLIVRGERAARFEVRLVLVVRP